ncbi:MAG: TonB-dependent receptor [bacterium]
MRWLAILTMVLLTAPVVVAAPLDGVVTDRQNRPLADVSVVTNIGGIGTSTDEDGAFRLESDDGVTRITFSSIGYRSRQFSRGQLPDTVVLELMYYPQEKIVVTAGRAERGLSPVAFDNITGSEIERDYTMGDVPLLLESTPNFYAFSNTGGGLGEVEFKIRGYNSKRISVYIDGVPLNDPEDHATYFVDIPDFAAEVTDIQVQRGVGLSMYGDASFGGSINIASGDIARPRQVTLTTGFGGIYEGSNYIGDMRKQSVAFSSGLVDGRWSVSGRYSKQYSDGYRQQSWFDSWSYFFSMSRLDHRMTTTLNIYGGPVNYHLAYYGISRDSLKTNRRFNPFTYGNQTGPYNQPHYELHHTYDINDRLTLKNTLYYIRGKGYYEQFKDDCDYDEYNIPPPFLSDPTMTEINLVRQKWANKQQYGWNPRLDWHHQQGRATFGGALYYFRSEHYGQVVWAENLAGGIDPRHRYYEYFGEKYLASLFANESRHFGEQVVVTASLQLKYLKYDFEQTKMGAFLGHQYDLNWLFLSPRVGLTYTFDEQTSAYTSFAFSSREPDDAAIYDGDDPDKFPQLEILFNYGDTLYEFGDPTVAKERVYDAEIGLDHRGNRYRWGVNLYWMLFENENIFEGGYDADWREITIFMDRSVHAGIELTGSVRPVDDLTISGNLALSRNRITEYDTTLFYSVDSIAPPDTITLYESVCVDYDDRTTPLFPSYLGNLMLDYRYHWLRLTCRGRFVGKQYVDLYNIEELAIDPYSTFSVGLAVNIDDFLRVGRLTLSMRVDNLFGEKFETSGWALQNASRRPGESVVIDAWNAYIVGAERTFYTQARLQMF